MGSPGPTEQPATLPDLGRDRKLIGVGAGPESHGRGVDCFVEVGVRRDVVEETMGRGQVVLSGGGLM